MSGLMIAIFVKESILPNIKDIRSVSVRTGTSLVYSSGIRDLINFMYIFRNVPCAGQ